MSETRPMVTCDKCGKTVDKEPSMMFGYTSPSKWKSIDYKDLCPKCWKEANKIISKWISLDNEVNPNSKKKQNV